MTEEEKNVWERFMDHNPGKFETVDYDFRVGEGSTVPMGTEENYSRMITMLSQKRIDVVGWVGNSPVIIEVKRRAGLSALGQVIGYRNLFEKDFVYFKSTELVVVCEVISNDDKFVLEANDVEVYVV